MVLKLLMWMISNRKSLSLKLVLWNNQKNVNIEEYAYSYLQKQRNIAHIKRHNHPHTVARAAFLCTDRAGVQPIGRRLSLLPQTLTCDQTTVHSPGLHFSGFHPRNYMDYYSFTDLGRMEGWVGLVGWPIAETVPTKWSHGNHRWGIDYGKSASQRPTS